MMTHAELQALAANPRPLTTNETANLVETALTWIRLAEDLTNPTLAARRVHTASSDVHKNPEGKVPPSLVRVGEKVPGV
jgi:hypothetical protein